MNTVARLELQLWKTLQKARMVPQEADLGVIWNELERAIINRDLSVQLEVSAEAILQIAGLVHERSKMQFEELVARHSDEGPVMPADAFDPYVRQSMEVDFDPFMEPFERKEHDYPDSRSLFSVVAEVSKVDLLNSLGFESVVETIWEDLAYDEDIGAWASTIRRWLQRKQVKAVTLIQLEEQTGLSIVKLWLAGLLSGFEMKQDGTFYDERIVIFSSPPEEIL
jgi:hypothetical protein